MAALRNGGGTRFAPADVQEAMRTDEKRLANAVLERYGHTLCMRTGVHIERGGPTALFRLLCGALLCSAPIRAEAALEALRSLIRADQATPKKMASASWQQRVDALADTGYKRYDEKTATQLGELAERVLEVYRGDLRELRSVASHDSAQEKRLLKEFKGIGDVGADIFLREVQGIWDEVYPHADERVLTAADKLGFGREIERIAALVPRERFPALAASLVQADQDGSYDELLRVA